MADVTTGSTGQKACLFYVHSEPSINRKHGQGWALNTFWLNKLTKGWWKRGSSCISICSSHHVSPVTQGQRALMAHGRSHAPRSDHKQHLLKEWELSFFFYDFFFMQAIFLKSSLNLLQYCTCFMFSVFGPWGKWDVSSPTRDQTHTPCIGRWSLNHWITRQVPGAILQQSTFLSFEERTI